MKHFLKNQDISFDSLRLDCQRISWSSLRSDLFAGITVSMLTVPMSMAYALIAGLPLTCGLFASIFATIITALFGCSRQMVVGPTNAIAILVQAGTAQVLYTYYRGVEGLERDMLAVNILTQLTLLVGVFQMLVAAGGLARLTQFVSHSVVVGYMAGTAAALVVNQLFIFLGMELPSTPMSLLGKVGYLITHLNEIDLLTMAVGCACLLAFLIMKRVNTRIPAAAIMLAAAGAVLYFFRVMPGTRAAVADPFAEEYVARVWLVGDAGQIWGILPHLALPFFDMGLVNALFPIAVAIALVSILETTSVSKCAAARTGERLSLNQEVMGLGLGNLISSLFGGLPSSGSPTRTHVNAEAGAQTRLAAVFSGLTVAILMIVFGYFISFIPLAALAALLFVTAFSLVDRKQFKMCLQTSRADRVVLLVTMASCFVFSVDIAFYIGIAMSVTFYLDKAASPHLVEYRMDDAGDYCGVETPGTTPEKVIRVINVQGELFFGAADLFQATLKTLAEEDHSTRVIILRLKHARDLDATACMAIQQLSRYLRESGRYLVGCSITSPVWDVLRSSGVADDIGIENLFQYDPDEPHLSVKNALTRARELASRSLDLKENGLIGRIGLTGPIGPEELSNASNSSS